MSATDSAASPPPPHPAASAAPHTVHVVHPAPSRFQGLGAIALLIGTVLVMGVVVLFFFQMAQNKPQPMFSGANGETGDVAALRDRLASDEARLSAIERANGGASPALSQAQADLAALTARVAKLETTPDPAAGTRIEDIERRLSAMRGDLDLRVAALERNALTTDIPQRLAAITTAQAALEARIAHLEGIEPSETMKRAAAELALANLVAVSGSEQPFTSELQTFRTFMPNASEAATLVPIALRGAPTHRMLAERFPDMAAKALAAEKAGRASTWLGRLWANFANIIVVRRVGETAGQDSESILARAGAKLDKHDLAGCIAEMKALKGAARASATPWLNDAQARLAIDQTNAVLAQRLMKLLATP